MNEIVVVAAVDADRVGDRPRVGAGARGTERDVGAAGGDLGGRCADVELALVRDAVAAFSARDAGGQGRGGERTAGAARAAEAERRAVQAQAGAGTGGDSAVVWDDIVALAAADSRRGGERARGCAGAPGAGHDGGAAGWGGT